MHKMILIIKDYSFLQPVEFWAEWPNLLFGSRKGPSCKI